MKFGYARISTPKQSLENQISLLEDNGCEKIFSDVISGIKSEKPGFERLMEMLRKEDILMVTGIDRLGRSNKDLLILLDILHEKGVHLYILGHENLDTRTAAGKMIFSLMAMLADNERIRNVERIEQAIAEKKRKGFHIGRPQKLEEEKVDRMIELYHSKSLFVREICSMYNITRGTFYNYLRKSS